MLYCTFNVIIELDALLLVEMGYMGVKKYNLPNLVLFGTQ